MIWEKSQNTFAKRKKPKTTTKATEATTKTEKVRGKMQRLYNKLSYCEGFSKILHVGGGVGGFFHLPSKHRIDPP